ncbi:sensor histidine kinase [Micromonospora halophytica]|uniref:histidine kinase n=1 Tax=Micromonospora halophytica TaxID=47864 RepID=A0A1C5IVD7_9ACTN|nr:ATP-binding protein [Micromonospora halophytica]SCG62314.1 Signal transduction histidine kinase [Micromonospora halophytica]
MNGWSRLSRVAELRTTRAGVERTFSYLIAGVRLGTVAQMIPAVNTGVATSPHASGYLACWIAAAVASVAVSVATLVRRRPLGAAAAAVDFALACTLLVLGPLVLEAGERFGTWVAYQPGYALSIIITASGVRSVALWGGGLLGVSASYLVYLGGELGGDMTSSAIGNILTYVVYALVARMLFGYIRRIAHDADASRARAAELARREEERRAQVMMHNGVAVMRLLTEPEGGLPRSRLIDLAEVELRRMRTYLRGRVPGGDESATAGGDGSGPSVALAAMIERACDRFADLSIDTLLDLGADLRLPAAQAEALERAFESLLLNVRVHARAAEVVVHLDQAEDRSWTLTVRDDGVGFDPGSVQAGVGLREVVVGELRRRGLDVRIESAVGEGTTVTIASGPEAAAGRVDGDAFVDEAA